MALATITSHDISFRLGNRYPHDAFNRVKELGTGIHHALGNTGHDD